MSFDDDLREGVEGVSHDVYMSTKSQIVEHYRETYGEKKWKGVLAAEISGTSNTKSRDYLSAMRNFQGSRLSREGKTKKWEDFGKNLPPLRKELNKDQKEITVTVKGEQKTGGYRGGSRRRTIMITLSGSDAFSFINGSIDLQTLGSEYYGFDFTEDSGGDSSSGELDLTSVTVS